MKCPKCGNECDDSAKFCPNCGYNFTGKSKKKSPLIPIVVVVALIAVVCLALFIPKMQKEKALKEKIGVINTFTSKASDISAITQQDYDTAYQKYNELSESEKAKVTNSDVFSKYNGINIDTVNDYQAKINQLTSNESSKFMDYVSLNDSIKGLSEKDKALLTGVDTIEEHLALTDLEKAGLSAVQNVRETLKNPDSIQISNLTVIDGLSDLNYYLVTFEYTAQNGFGGNSNGESGQMISSKFVNDIFELEKSLSAIMGGDKYTSLTATPEFMKLYIQRIKNAVDIDTEKIMYYIDEDVRQK